MKSKFLISATALGFAAVLAASVPSASIAAPMGAGVGEALKSANVSDVTEVRHRHRGRYWAYGLGGVALGAALAAPYYYGGGYYPAYRQAPRRCWVQTGPYRGQGYYDYC